MEKLRPIHSLRRYTAIGSFLIAAVGCADDKHYNNYIEHLQSSYSASTTPQTELAIPTDIPPESTTTTQQTVTLPESPITTLPLPPVETTTTSTSLEFIPPPPTTQVDPYSCEAAIEYLQRTTPDGTEIICPASPELTSRWDGRSHQAMSCIDVPGICEGKILVAIVEPCPQAYLNEAENIWIMYNYLNGKGENTSIPDYAIDLHGHC